MNGAVQWTYLAIEGHPSGGWVCGGAEDRSHNPLPRNFAVVLRPH